jgi:hypothetical protein
VWAWGQELLYVWDVCPQCCASRGMCKRLGKYILTDWFNATDLKATVGLRVQSDSANKTLSILLTEMAQLFSARPYGFCGGWRWFVLCQFRTRYCGHTLSRLAEIRHNKTKQTAFPTIRRERASKELEWNSVLA